MSDNWKLREKHKRAVRAARRGWPPQAVRPVCIGCEETLPPLWDRNPTAYDGEVSSETDVLKGWDGCGGVFHSNHCALRWALRQPFVQAARLNNEVLAEKLRNQRQDRSER